MKKALLIILCIFGAIALIFGGCTLANVINASSLNAYIDTFERVEIENQLQPARDEHGNTYFTTDEDFKVMHLTDIHIGGGFLSTSKDKKVINAVAAMISAEKPDLVVITGDISFPVPWIGTMNNAYAHGFMKRLMENLGVYWTVTFGNHDSEAYNFYDREDVAKMYLDESMEYCLFECAGDDLSGEGNHVINVKNTEGKVTQSLFMIDTHAYTDKDPLGLNWDYDYIKDDQIEWYRDTVNLYSGENGETVKSLMFFHIPLREVKAAYDEYVGNNRQNTENVTYIEGVDGEVDEVVYCSRQDENMFETVLELDSTKAMFYGHDHLNNFVLDYKGVTLSYGYSMDYLAYSGIDSIGAQRGCTVITVSPDSSFEIVHENYYQDKYVPLYEKEAVSDK